MKPELQSADKLELTKVRQYVILILDSSAMCRRRSYIALRSDVCIYVSLFASLFLKFLFLEGPSTWNAVINIAAGWTDRLSFSKMMQ